MGRPAVDPDRRTKSHVTMTHGPLYPRSSCLVAIALCWLVLDGCAGTPRPLDELAGQSILSRMQDRKRLITSAAYRVRWQARGTEPHGEFFLEIAYKAPDRFRVSATGPFGIPAFTGVILGDKFWFVDHRNGRLIKDDLANLGKYEIPLSSFFADYWRDLFAGGWGGTEVVAALVPSPKPDVYDGRSGESHWSVAWDWHKAGPRRITLKQPGGKEPLICDLLFGQYSAATPFWQLERLEFRGLRTGGEHRWRILKQDYNIDIPDRFFEPLQPPSKDQPRKPK